MAVVSPVGARLRPPCTTGTAPVVLASHCLGKLDNSTLISPERSSLRLLRGVSMPGKNSHLALKGEKNAHALGLPADFLLPDAAVGWTPEAT